MDFVDIFTMGEVVQYLKELVNAGQVNECIHLKVQKGFLGAFYPECAECWASRVQANNVYTDDLAYDAPSSYDWPKCPPGCPKYSPASNFVDSLSSSAQSILGLSAYPYVDPVRIPELEKSKTPSFDLKKLIELCKELNVADQQNLVFAVPMLVRAILDHVPPILGFKTFQEVANNYSGGKSFKEAMDHLENTSRKIANSFLHAQIRNKEALPTKTQVDFRNGLDMLLQEIVRILK